MTNSTGVTCHIYSTCSAVKCLWSAPLTDPPVGWRTKIGLVSCRFARRRVQACYSQKL
jgi:hypothetical protein